MSEFTDHDYLQRISAQDRIIRELRQKLDDMKRQLDEKVRLYDQLMWKCQDLEQRNWHYAKTTKYCTQCRE